MTSLSLFAIRYSLFALRLSPLQRKRFDRVILSERSESKDPYSRNLLYAPAKSGDSE